MTYIQHKSIFFNQAAKCFLLIHNFPGFMKFTYLMLLVMTRLWRHNLNGQIYDNISEYFDISCLWLHICKFQSLGYN